jgi:hypothetical protein
VSAGPRIARSAGAALASARAVLALILLLLATPALAVELPLPPPASCRPDDEPGPKTAARLLAVAEALDGYDVRRAVAELQESGTAGATALAVWLDSSPTGAPAGALRRARLHVLRCGVGPSLGAAKPLFDAGRYAPEDLEDHLDFARKRGGRLDPGELAAVTTPRALRSPLTRARVLRLLLAPLDEVVGRPDRDDEVAAVERILDAGLRGGPGPHRDAWERTARLLADAFPRGIEAEPWCSVAVRLVGRASPSVETREHVARAVDAAWPVCAEAVVDLLIARGEPEPLSALLVAASERLMQQPCRPSDGWLAARLAEATDPRVRASAESLGRRCAREAR